jgi:hypothetical protein
MYYDTYKRYEAVNHAIFAQFFNVI